MGRLWGGCLSIVENIDQVITAPHWRILHKHSILRKPTRDITVNIFSARFFLFPQVFFYFRKVIFYFRKVCFISARFVLFPQGLFYFRKVCFISARFTYLRKVLFISARFVSFPQGYIISARFILFPQGYFYFPKVSSFIFSIWVVTIENIFAEIKITLRK